MLPSSCVQKINRLLKQNDLDAMVKLVQFVLNNYQNDDLKDVIKHACSEYLVMHLPDPRLPCVIIEEKRALSCLTGLYVTISLNCKQKQKSLENTLLLLQSLKPSTMAVITKQKAKELFNLVDKKRFLDKIKYNKYQIPLRVFILPYADTRFNSSYNYETNAVVVNPNSIEPDSSLEYIFLHELGHAYHLAFTGSEKVFPESFIKMFELSFNNKWSVVLPEHRSEIFADCFATTVVYNTSYSSLVPFCQDFTHEHLEINEKFFKMINENFAL